MKRTSSGNAARVSESAQDEPAFRELTAVRVEQLPKEAGWLLITAGVVGLVVPGVLGTPFLLAGALTVTTCEYESCPPDSLTFMPSG
jgi:hypothetical protein